MSTRRLSRIAILAALAIALRIVFAQFPNVKPVTALFLVCLFYLDLSDSLLVMAMTMLGSSLLFGFGVVVFWQILSFGVILLVWWYGIVPFAREFDWVKWLLPILAGLSAFLYGFVISIPIAVQFQTNLIVYWINGLVFDLAHAVSTGLFFPILYQLFWRFFKHEKRIS